MSQTLNSDKQAVKSHLNESWLRCPHRQAGRRTPTTAASTHPHTVSKPAAALASSAACLRRAGVRALFWGISAESVVCASRLSVSAGHHHTWPCEPSDKQSHSQSAAEPACAQLVSAAATLQHCGACCRELFELQMSCTTCLDLVWWTVAAEVVALSGWEQCCMLKNAKVESSCVARDGQRCCCLP